MRNFLRTPLTWLVIAEFIVLGALVFAAWHAITSAVRPAQASPALQAPAPPGGGEASPLPDLPAVTKPATGPLPGLNADTYFWRLRLAQLNQEQVAFEQLEWRIVHGAVTAIERYMQNVVIPSIQRAEGARA